MNKTKAILGTLVLILIIAIVGYNYLYQDHRDIKSEKAAYVINAKDLINAFQANEVEATTKYLNKTITITGNLTSVEGTSVVVENAVFLALSENKLLPSNNLLNTIVRIKGRCIGYDNLLEEVKLDQASVLK